MLFEYIAANAAAYGGYSLATLVKLLNNAGYSVLRITGSGQLCVLDSRPTGDDMTNDYIAIPPSASWPT